MTKRPLDILDQVLNRQPVIVSLKGGREIRGVLQGYDVHMNLVLDKAEETENGQVQKVGTLIVRGARRRGPSARGDAPRSRRQSGHALELPREEAGSLLLPQGFHARLHA